VVRVGEGYVCLAAECPFASRELLAVAGHVASNQYEAETKEVQR
jgi:hypothetical protein